MAKRNPKLKGVRLKMKQEEREAKESPVSMIRVRVAHSNC